MDKKQLRLYAKKFEGAAELVRLLSGVLALIGFWLLMDFFTTSMGMAIASAVYLGAVGYGYWWCRKQWKMLLAPLPKKAIKKKPALPKEPNDA